MAKINPRPHISKMQFIREIAKRSNFTIADVKIIWQVICDIFHEAIEAELEIDIHGFGHLYTRKIKERTTKHPRTLKQIHYGESTRVLFRMSRNFKDIVRPIEKRTYANNKEKARKIKEYYDNLANENLGEDQEEED